MVANFEGEGPRVRCSASTNEKSEFEDERNMIARAIGLLKRDYKSKMFARSSNGRWVAHPESRGAKAILYPVSPVDSRLPASPGSKRYRPLVVHMFSSARSSHGLHHGPVSPEIAAGLLALKARSVDIPDGQAEERRLSTLHQRISNSCKRSNHVTHIWQRRNLS